MTISLPTRRFGGFLFDMDGTILSSIASAERAWTAWATRQGLDVAAFLPTIHGVQSVETIRRLNLPGVDPVAEAHALTEAEMLDVGDVVPIGVRPRSWPRCRRIAGPSSPPRRGGWRRCG